MKVIFFKKCIWKILTENPSLGEMEAIRERERERGRLRSEEQMQVKIKNEIS